MRISTQRCELIGNASGNTPESQSPGIQSHPRALDDEELLHHGSQKHEVDNVLHGVPLDPSLRPWRLTGWQEPPRSSSYRLKSIGWGGGGLLSFLPSCPWPSSGAARCGA